MSGLVKSDCLYFIAFNITVQAIQAAFVIFLKCRLFVKMLIIIKADSLNDVHISLDKIIFLVNI